MSDLLRDFLQSTLDTAVQAGITSLITDVDFKDAFKGQAALNVAGSILGGGSPFDLFKNKAAQPDIARVIKELSAEYPWFNDLDDVRKDAMIDISFNLGATRLRGFRRALAAMEVADHTLAAKEFLDSKWSRDVKGRAHELASMIETGEYLL
jgi:hypothetical protein